MASGRMVKIDKKSVDCYERVTRHMGCDFYAGAERKYIIHRFMKLHSSSLFI
jgi:hypothetical protein